MQPGLILFVSPLFVRLTVQYRLHHWKYIWFVSLYFVDLKAMEAAVRSIVCDGLEWKASKYISVSTNSLWSSCELSPKYRLNLSISESSETV